MADISRQELVDKIDSIAQDATLAAQLDIALSDLRDAIAGAGGDATTAKDLLDKLEAIRLLVAAPLTVTGTVDIGASALPAGAATGAKQDTAKGVLDNIKTNTDALNATLTTTDTYRLRGLIAGRPAANAVAVGTTFWAADRLTEADEFSVSDGTDWHNISTGVVIKV
jgi:hypothetical protein